MPPSLLPKHCIYSRLTSANSCRRIQTRQSARLSTYYTQSCGRLLSTSTLSSHTRACILPSISSYQPRSLSRNGIRNQLARPLSISPRRWDRLKWEGKETIRYALYFYAFIILGSIMQFGAKDERHNRLFPTPPEWGWYLRHQLRKTRGEETFYDTSKGVPNWPLHGMRYRAIVKRLEGNSKYVDTTKMSMEERVRLEKAGVPFDGFNFNGFDVSEMSIPWREGYYTALMGAARAAEFLEGLVTDVTRGEIFSADRVIGPSNPRPKPQPYGAIEAPLEENCAPAFLSPKVFYRKILATEGLSARQRLEASLAWANWLSATGQDEEAEDKYDWALDIAMSDLPEGINNVVDIRTGCINEGATYITEGIITATTALASFHAQQHKFSVALPIFASILRAYRSLPPPSTTSNIPTQVDLQPESAWSILWSSIVSALSEPPYPNPPPSISVPLISNAKQTCSEAAVMSNLGEVLFASSKSSPSSPPSPTSPILRAFSSSKTPSQPVATPAELSGLSWTSSAVDQTEATIHDLINRPPYWKTREEVQEMKEHCAECLTMAVENWKRMVSILEEREFDAEMKEKEKKAQVREDRAEKGWCEGLWSSLFSPKTPDTPQQGSEAAPATVDANLTPVTNIETGAMETLRTDSESRQTPSQGPWAQEMRKVEQRFLEIRRKIREERIVKKDMLEKGLWGLG